MLDENTEAVSEEAVEDSAAGALESEKPKKRTKRTATAAKSKDSAKGESRKDGRRTRPTGRRPLSTRRRPGAKRIGGSSSTDGENSQNESNETAKKNLPPLTDENRVISIPQLEALGREQLLNLAEDVSSQQDEFVSKEELVTQLLSIHGDRGGEIITSGMLDIANDGYGFLRHGERRHSSTDVYVSQSQIRKFGLRTGDDVSGQIRPPKNGEKYYGLLKVLEVNSKKPDLARMRPAFDKLTALFPDQLFDLEHEPKALAPRLLNLIAPIGKGQRGLIVSPPKAGKTILLHQIADALTENYPDVQIFAALIGERPEEVTDWQRTVKGASVYASTFDEPVEEHTRVAEIVLSRAKRQVEEGKDVVILLDSITRLARAYNLSTPSSGRTLSGGIDPIALYPPKNFFGAARNTEEEGTLTIIATCLVDTGSRMDDVIYEEFKGTGNMEVHLDRGLAERRIYPSIDIPSSSTRRDDRLFDEKSYRDIVVMRRMVGLLAERSNDPSEVTQIILDRIQKTKNNQEFMSTLNDSH
tara:strand:+ start:22292 stop:23875 length:1584 start_codon:yes stop_codon:yes gene_type:complete